MFIASFLQLWITNKTKTFKNQKNPKSKKSKKKSVLVTFIAWSMQNFGIQIRKYL